MQEQPKGSGKSALETLAQAFLGACILAVAYACYVGENTQILAVASISLLLLSSSALIGGALGFLFGIPRTLQGDNKATPGNRPEVPLAPVNADEKSRPLFKSEQSTSDYIANTNLEQISDWLTKILVGVGLTQITQIKDSFQSVVENVTPALGGAPYAAPFATTLILIGTLTGFLFGYLWTRLFLIGAFRQADRISELFEEVKIATQKVETAEQQIDDLMRQGHLDVAALNLIDKQLNPRPDLSRPSEQEIAEAISRASKSVRTQIFYRARDFRSKTWRDPSSKATMELTIPVFRALIAADEERLHHGNHGQLGYALKDKMIPDYAEAEKAFTTAIVTRNRLSERGWVFYELCRAICIIKQDANFLLNQPSDENLKTKVADDLRHAFHEESARRIAKDEPAIVEWSKINSITFESLRNT